MALEFTQDDELLTPQEVSKIVKRTIDTLRWWRYVGEGPKFFKISSRSVLYKRSDVMEWLNEKYIEFTDKDEFESES